MHFVTIIINLSCHFTFLSKIMSKMLLFCDGRLGWNTGGLAGSNLTFQRPVSLTSFLALSHGVSKGVSCIPKKEVCCYQTPLGPDKGNQIAQKVGLELKVPGDSGDYVEWVIFSINF
jgi:hypothetical protein